MWSVGVVWCMCMWCGGVVCECVHVCECVCDVCMVYVLYVYLYGGSGGGVYVCVQCII